MALWFLPNSFGAYATSQTTGTVASGYDKTNLIAGPRSTKVRTTAVAGPNNFLGYESDADIGISHVVIARADWLIAQTAPRVYVSERAAGGTWHDTAEFDLDPVSAADLVGISSQDFAAEVTPTHLRGLRIVMEPDSTAHPMQISKLFGSVGVTLGPPALGIEFEPLPPDSYARPPLGMIPYEVEGRFGFRFESIPAADAAAFQAIPELLNWPLFLYDDAGDIWDWKLEHVIVENYTLTMTDPGLDIYDLAVTFNRLRHYP